MRRSQAPLLAALALVAAPAAAGAQQLPTDNPALRRIWEEGMERSRAYELAQTLMDSLGPRLTGSPESEAASAWVVSTYGSWGIDAHKEAYGTWNGWRRGITHVDLVEPRVRSLEATMLAWSPGTHGPVTGPVVTIPPMSSPADFDAFLGSVGGKFVLLDMAEPTCRPDANWEEWATPDSFDRLQAQRDSADDAWNSRLQATGLGPRGLADQIAARLDAAGAAGILTSYWSRGWGVDKVFDAATETIPTVDIGCEDYGLLFRLAENHQGPVLRVEAEAEALGEVEVANTIGMIRGSELPDEYVVLSAHFDSWDGGSGATDNGTGTITMMEAMRILKAVYPNPRRTILVGHWNSEEQGLNGSRAFAADHPDIVEGIQALFNQDNGTGRVANISMQGLTEVAPYFAEWFAEIPEDITGQIDLRIPGTPGGGGSDYASFICAGAPAFSLSSLSWDYSTYTWHTNRDTFDKIVRDDLRNNATLTAMLAYLASEEPDRLPRTRRAVLPPNRRTGEPGQWPTCQDGQRSAG